MQRFDKKGMMIIPNPGKKELREAREVVLINELYCPNGHSLISKRCSFNGHPGVLLCIKQGNQQGIMALSPVFGDKTRVTLDIDLYSGETVALCCPTCGDDLPVHSPCACGADMVTLFLTKKADFSNCVGICNRVDCVNAHIIESGELFNQARLELG